VFCRVHHDAYVPLPNDQIAGLWLRYPNKTFSPDVEIKGIGVRIRIASKCVNFVDQVRAVRSSVRLPLALPCGVDNGLALSQRYRARCK
jgi:hypothetical protein